MQGRSGGHGRRRPDEDRVRQHQTRRMMVTVWSTVVGVVAFGILAAAFVFWLRPVLQRDQDTTAKDRIAAESRTKIAAEFNAPSATETLAIVNRALAVSDPKSVAAVIRPGTMTHKEVVAKLHELSETEGAVVGRTWLSSVDKNGLSLEGVELTYRKGEKTTKRLAFLTPDKEGIWKLDFPALVRWVDPSWDELLSGSAKSGLVRVKMARDRYYNGPFLEESIWAAYGMISPDLKEELLVGYCKRDSDQYQAMERMGLGAEGVVVRATLELRRVEGAERRQFEISRVLAEDWVMGEKAFDGTVDPEK